jgi:hypothetical protein
MSHLRAEQALAQAIRGQVQVRQIALDAQDGRTDPVPISSGATRLSIDVQDAGTAWIVELKWTLSIDLEPVHNRDLTSWHSFAPAVQIDSSVRAFVLNTSVFGVGYVCLEVVTADPAASEAPAVFLIR